MALFWACSTPFTEFALPKFIISPAVTACFYQRECNRKTINGGLVWRSYIDRRIPKWDRTHLITCCHFGNSLASSFAVCEIQTTIPNERKKKLIFTIQAKTRAGWCWWCCCSPLFYNKLIYSIEPNTVD